jgi:hypothetical protein
VTSSLPPPPRPVVAESGGAGSVAVAGAAGCMGLSLVSTGLLVLLGLAVLAGAVVVAAVVWRPPVVAGPIDVPRDEVAARFERATPLGPAGNQRVQKQIVELAPEIARQCGHPARVEAELLVVPSGQVLYARIADGGLGQVDPRCLKRRLEGVRLDTPPQREGIARVEFAL